MHIGLAWLKWLTVVVPTAFMAVFTLWGYSFLDRLSLAGVGVMIAVIVVGVAAFLFSRFVFSSIQGLQQTVLQRNRELSALYSVTREASKSLDPAQVMTGALEVVAEVFQAQRAGIFVLNPETGQLTLSYGYGLPSQLLGAVAAGDMPDCACQEAVSTLQPVWSASS